MNIEILAASSAVPCHELCQDDALALAHRICCSDQRQARLASALFKHAGVKTRYTALPPTEAYRWSSDESREGDAVPNVGPSTEERMGYFEEHALPLAVRAAQVALVRSECMARDVTHVVTASCTGFTAPGIDSGLIQTLQLRPTTQRVHVGFMGCHGAINALRVAQGLAYTHARARVLVATVELCSLHYAFHWDNERMLGNALFADGAGAVMVGAFADRSSSNRHRWRLAATGSYLFPGTTDAMKWRVGNHGFAMTISSQLPHLVREHVGGWLTAWLAENGLRTEDIQSWAVHPGGPKILEAVESAMDLSAEMTRVSRQVLSEYGNMSSATLLFILESLLEKEAPPPCVMLGFGPGLVAEAALLI